MNCFQLLNFSVNTGESDGATENWLTTSPQTFAVVLVAFVLEAMVGNTETGKSRTLRFMD